ncbi:MAG: FAD binding domain-containing protein, partial [Pseudomonadota bacterium]
DLSSAERALGEGARFLGGGTILMRAVNEGAPELTRLVRARERADDVRIDYDTVTLGAGVTMARIAAERDLAILGPVARAVGGPAIRSAATVGGNLHAEAPYGDFAVALLALGARIAFAEDREPSLDLEAFFAARERYRDRIIRAVRFDRPRDASEFRFKKVQRVHPKGVAVMTMAAHVPRSGEVRVAYGNMALTPVRVSAVERALSGGRLDARTIAAAASVATEGLDPPTDPLATGWYRREVAPVHLTRMLEGR